MANEAPNIKTINTGNRACRTAPPALLAVSEHLDIIEAFGKFQVVSHRLLTSSYFFK
jgi:hypothetical protein